MKKDYFSERVIVKGALDKTSAPRRKAGFREYDYLQINGIRYTAVMVPRSLRQYMTQSHENVVELHLIPMSGTKLLLVAAKRKEENELNILSNSDIRLMNELKTSTIVASVCACVLTCLFELLVLESEVPFVAFGLSTFMTLVAFTKEAKRKRIIDAIEPLSDNSLPK